MLETNITGLDDLQKLLDQLPANVEKKIIRGALRAGQKVVLDQAKQAIHNVSGDLAKSLRISTKMGRDGLVTAKVIAGNGKAYYAHMVEFGTARHYIKPKNKKSLFLAGVFAEGVDHPGAQKKPFMRPAADAAMSETSEAMEAFKAYCSKRIGKEMDKLPDEVDGVTT